MKFEIAPHPNLVRNWDESTGTYRKFIRLVAFGKRYIVKKDGGKMTERIGKAARHYGKKYHEAQETIAAQAKLIETLGKALIGFIQNTDGTPILFITKKEKQALALFENWLKERGGK